jgi:acyl transferase domain-containing protein
VKSNIGHLEGASGLAAVIKAILILEHGIIPPNANFEKLSPRIDADGLNLKVGVRKENYSSRAKSLQIPTEAVTWPSQGLRRVSINSFGASGTNAHAVLDDAYHYLTGRGLRGNHRTVVQPGLLMTDVASQRCTGAETAIPRLLLFCASNKAALQRMTGLFDAWLTKKIASTQIDNTFLNDLVYTLAQRRTILPSRTFALVDDVQSLKNFKHRLSLPGRATDQAQVAFVFTGQGAQWPGMGRELLQLPLFRDSVSKSQLALRTLGCSWNVTGKYIVGLPRACKKLSSYIAQRCLLISRACVISIVQVLAKHYVPSCR